MASRFWVGGSGTWDASSTANWAATSGGASGASAPTSADAVTFDGNSGTAAVVLVDGAAVCNTCTVNKSDITLSLAGSPTFVGNVTLTIGTIELNSYVLTCAGFTSSNSNIRTLAFGTGKMVVTGSGASVWATPNPANLTVTGTPLVELSYAGATATTIASGAATEANSISFSVLAGSYVLSQSSSHAVRDFTFSNAFTGQLINGNRTVYGNLTLSSNMTLATGAGTTTFGATSGTKTITSNGQTMDFPITFNGVGGSWNSVDNLTVGATRTVTLTNGTLNGNGQNISLGSFALGSGVKTLTLGSGTWTVTGSGTAWNANTNVTNLTVSASTGIVNMVSASAKTFAGGGKSWPTLNQGGSGALTIQQANTFANITNTVQPATITFPASTTTTVSAFGVSGNSGNLITLNSSTSGTRATLSDASGVNSVSFCDIKDINATGGAIWNSLTSNGNIDGGNNLNWNFSVTPETVSEVTYALRSFTTPRRF